MPKDKDFWDLDYTPPKRNVNPAAGDRDTSAVMIESDAPVKKTEEKPRAFTIVTQGSELPDIKGAVRTIAFDEYVPAKKTASLPRKTEQDSSGTADIPSETQPSSLPAGNLTADPKPDDSAAAKNSFASASFSLSASGLNSAIRTAAGAYRQGQQRARRDDTRAADHKPELILSYTRENALIRAVSVYKWPSRYGFYERFCIDAKRYFAARGTECHRVEFFSYIPQYSQMTRAQLEYYLWWRENIRKGVNIGADFSYILLYVYEIINLPEQIRPEDGIRMLCELWISCRDKHPRIDKYLCEWVCDYCLIYDLELPFDLLSPILSKITERASLKEFFLANTDSYEAFAASLAAFSSNYDFRTGKFAAEKDVSILEQHVTGCLAAVLRSLGGDKSPIRALEAINGEGLRPLKISRDAFCGSLCAYNIKRRIDVEYLSLVRSHELRILITSLVKYTENRVRAANGIKSRLGAGEIPPQLKAAAEAYFDTVYPKKSSGGRHHTAGPGITEPDYERYYDAPVSKLTPEEAAEIERRAWGITERLVEAFSESTESTETVISVDSTKFAETANFVSEADFPEDSEEEFIPGAISMEDVPDTPGTLDMPDTLGAGTVITPAPAIFEAPALSADDSEAAQFIASLASWQADFLRAVLAGGSVDELCRENGKMPLVAADEINEAAADIYGDIVLEIEGGRICAVEDYREELMLCLKQ